MKIWTWSGFGMIYWLTEGRHDDHMAWTVATASGLGKVELVAPFIPTLPGTDAYVDDLR